MAHAPPPRPGPGPRPPLRGRRRRRRRAHVARGVAHGSRAHRGRRLAEPAAPRPAGRAGDGRGPARHLHARARRGRAARDALPAPDGGARAARPLLLGLLGARLLGAAPRGAGGGPRHRRTAHERARHPPPDRAGPDGSRARRVAAARLDRGGAPRRRLRVAYAAGSAEPSHRPHRLRPRRAAPRAGPPPRVRHPHRRLHRGPAPGGHARRGSRRRPRLGRDGLPHRRPRERDALRLARDADGRLRADADPLRAAPPLTGSVARPGCTVRRRAPRRSRAGRAA